MNKKHVILAYRNGVIKQYFAQETENMIRKKYSANAEKELLRNMLTDSDSVLTYLEYIHGVRKAVKVEMEDIIGHEIDVGIDVDIKHDGIIHRVETIEPAAAIAFVKMAENGVIDDVTASEHTEMFSPWTENVSYTVGALRMYDDKLYRCLQAHTSQIDWTPNVASSLWAMVGDPTEEFPAWSQPIGAHDAYMTGDKVSYGGQHWISTVDGNVWEPGIYGWETIE